MIYEYRCEKCGTVFEMNRPSSEYKEPGECPKCDGQGHRILSTPLFKTGGGGHKNVIRQQEIVLW